jgi:D-methionine transport system ATP-binding protein
MTIRISSHTDDRPTEGVKSYSNSGETDKLNVPFQRKSPPEFLKLESLSKSYRLNGRPVSVVKNISLQINQGAIFGIIGRSGAGKSTLLRLINLLEKPDSGEIFLEGEALTSLSPQSLREKRKKIGFIFQHFNLISTKTVFENVALPLQLLGIEKAEIKARVEKLLNRVDLANFADRYPENLSGGQRQRVAIARSLATDPQILLCDEATSALDPESTTSILKLLQSLNRELGITIVLITHEMAVIKSICHDVAVLNEGELIETGPVVNVFSEPSHPVTKMLTQKAFHLELPELFDSKIRSSWEPGSYPLYRMTFVGKSASEPMTATLFEKFSVRVNILLADVEYFCDSHEGVQVGFLLSQFVGTQEAVEQAVEYLKDKNITVEGVGYVIL